MVAVCKGRAAGFRIPGRKREWCHQIPWTSPGTPVRLVGSWVCVGGGGWEFVQGNCGFSKVWGVQFKHRGWLCGIVLICVNACFLKTCKSFWICRIFSLLKRIYSFNKGANLDVGIQYLSRVIFPVVFVCLYPLCARVFVHLFWIYSCLCRMPFTVLHAATCFINAWLLYLFFYGWVCINKAHFLFLKKSGRKSKPLLLQQKGELHASGQLFWT